MTAVWLYGTHLGELERTRIGKVRFNFGADAHTRWGTGSMVMSTSMPIDIAVRPTGDIVAAFIAGLLPEGSALGGLSRLYAARDDFELLEAVGHDTAGALVVADDPTPPQQSLQMLSDEDVMTMLLGLEEHPLGASRSVRHSLAGAQRKLLLGRSPSGEWYLPSAANPSTHILKPAPPGWDDVARNEAYCMEIAQRSGLKACRTEVLEIGQETVLVAERYDRLGGRRTHQEDGCQMLGIAPSSKYQQRRGNRVVGPSLRRIAAYLSPVDRLELLRAQVVNVLVGNADCHGKNVSVLHPEDGSTWLAPIYDVMSTTCHPPVRTARGLRPLSTDLGMTIGKASQLEHVNLEELLNEAATWPIPRDEAREAVTSTVTHVSQAVAQSEHEFPEIARYALAAAERLHDS